MKIKLIMVIYISFKYVRPSVVMVPVIPLKLQGVPISLPDQGTAKDYWTPSSTNTDCLVTLQSILLHLPSFLFLVLLLVIKNGISAMQVSQLFTY